MKTFITKNWATRLLPAVIFAALIACGGKKDGGAGNAEINAGDIPKISQTGGGGIDSKDSEVSDPNDICSKEGDAYAKYGKLTNKTRDNVYQIATQMGFDSLYKSNPNTYTASDLKMMHDYFLKTDKLVYAKLSVEIEHRMAMAQRMAMFTAGMGAAEGALRIERNGSAYLNRKIDEVYFDLYTMVTARRNLFNLYATVFGMSRGYTWFDGVELDGELVTATKDIKDKLAANTSASAFEKAKVERGMVVAAQGTVMKVDNKYYVVHTVFSAERKDFMVELVEVTAQSINFAAYKDYTDVERKAAKELIAEYTAKIENIEKTFTAGPNTAQIERDYVEYVLSRDLVAKVFGMRERGELAIAEARTEDAATLSQQKTALEMQLKATEMELATAKTSKDEAKIAELTKKVDELRTQLKIIDEKLANIEKPAAVAPSKGDSAEAPPAPSQDFLDATKGFQEQTEKTNESLKLFR